jgi:alkylhydroperoxidase family enzyme
MSNIPRLSFDELEPALAAALQPRVERLGYLGEFFRCMGHQPAALRAFIEFTESAKAPLEKRIVEVIALTVATAKRNRYERHQHERLSVRLGFTREWVAEVEALTPGAGTLMSARDLLVQKFVLAVITEGGSAPSELLDEVVAQLGSAQTVASLMVIGRYVAHAAMVGALALDPPVPSIFEDGFGLQT